jgi:hypothetical protein
MGGLVSRLLGDGPQAESAASGAWAQTPADWGKVVEAAKKEARVVVHSGHVSHDAIAKAFDKVCCINRIVMSGC